MAEIVSGIAVVVTLAFLAFEMRNNTEEMRAANRQSLASRAEAYLLARAGTPELSQIITKIQDGQELSAGEVFMYRGFLSAILRNSEEAFLQYQEGRLDEGYFRQRGNAAASYFTDRVACDAYVDWANSDFYNEEFMKWLDEAVASICL